MTEQRPEFDTPGSQDAADQLDDAVNAPDGVGPDESALHQESVAEDGTAEDDEDRFDAG